MGSMGYFREDGLPNSANTAFTKGIDISTPSGVIAGREGSTINITDIIVSKTTDGIFDLYDGTTQFMSIDMKAAGNGQSITPINLTSAIALTTTSGLYIKLDSVEVDWGLTVNYYTSTDGR
jgi:hypothetical protein